ncbi:MAG: shikimate dehydrogenase [Candidatus Gastranaerophilaceae bacterium]
MAIDKMELLKRYKELKAQGVSITLMELKKQLEAEESSAQSNEPNKSLQEQPVYSSPAPTPAFVTNYTETPQQHVEISPQQPQVQPTTTSIFSSQQQTIQKQETQYTGNVTPLQTPTVQQEKIKKYALIGYPLGHSLSAYIHNAGFKSLGINATYEILETPPEKLVDRIKFFKSNNFAGFNITIPLKLPITMFLDEVDASADIVNAINTVVINPETKELKGYNTDVIGFRNAIPEDITLAGKSCGVLGTGGAARAAITALAQNQVKSIKLFTRNIPNCIELLNFLRERFPNIEFNAFQIERIRDLSDIEILVNTTPIGMQGRAADLTPVEENELRTLPQGAVVYDVIYNPKKTILLKLAQKNGYRTINGVDMFIHQALAAEQIWTGKTPDFKDMKIAALENL